MATRPHPEPALAAARADRSFFGHPRGLATLFFTEMWERFSYYGMRAILILFMTAPVARGGLGFPVVKAGAVYGLYTAMVYLLSLPGGWMADRITGQRRAVLYGGSLIALGEFCLVYPAESTFYLGLALLMLGTGMLKPNVSTIVGQLYAPGDGRRDAGFSIFYMGINLGALIAPLACGWVAERIGWRLGFGVAGLGMLVGVVQYLFGYRHLGTAGLHPSSTGDPAADRRQKRKAGIAATGVFAAIGLVALLGASGVVTITTQGISDTLGVFLILITVGVFSWLLLGKGWSTDERKRSAAILVLFLAASLFWAMFENAGSSFNLFAQRWTDRHIFGFEFPASWLQFVPPSMVVLLAPVFAWLWTRLGSREPSSPAKFTFGLLCGGLGFLILVPAAAQTGNGALASVWFLVGVYFMHTIGELCLSPVGLSAMTKLAPARVTGMMMGVFFLSNSVGNYMAGRVASLFESMSLRNLFGTVAAVGLGAAVVMALLIKPTKRLMSGVK